MKRRNLKTLGVVGLACVLGVSTIGCSSANKEVSETQSTQTTKENTSKTEETAATEQVAQKEEGPLTKYEAPITIKVGYALDTTLKFESGETFQDNTWMDLYKEYGINVETLYEVDESQEATKLATAIASGQYPDIMMVTGEEMINYAENGVIADIGELYDQYASEHMKEYMDTDGGAGLDSARHNGKLYGLPLLGNAYDALSIMWIRSDWLEKLNLEVPTTMEELKEVATAFTHNDPDGNGKNDTYGFALNGKAVFDAVGGVQTICEGFGAIPGYFDGKFTFVEKDGQIMWGGDLSNEMKEALTFMQGVYESGGLARDFGVMDGSKILDDASAGKCGIFFAPMWGAMTPQPNVLKVDPNAKYIAAPIPGKDANNSSVPYLSNGASNFYVVSSKCENPEALFKLFNLSVDKLCYPESEEEYLKYYGEAGKYTGWKCALTRTLVPLKNLDNYQKERAAVESRSAEGLNAEQKGDYENMIYYLDMKDNLDLNDPKCQSGISLYTVFADPQGGYAAIDELIKKDRFYPSAYNTIQTSTMADKYPILDKLTKETLVKIIVGDPVESYDKFLGNWHKLGGDEIIDEAANWYQTNK